MGDASSTSGWARLSGNMLAAFLVGEGLMVILAPERQTRLWSPSWSPGVWRTPLRALHQRPSLARALALAEVAGGLALAFSTNARPVDR